MRTFGIGMRWWLTLAFALIAAVTAVAVSEVFSRQSEAAFRSRAAELAIGASVRAAADVTEALEAGNVKSVLNQIAAERGLSLYVFTSTGDLITSTRSGGIPLSAVPRREEAVGRALDGHRFTASVDDGSKTVVALRLPAIEGALLSYAERPDLAEGLVLARGTIVEAALWAVLVGALVGLLIASLITARTRRIAAAAATIEQGSFDTPLRPRFRDELGALAETIDRMRARLRESFAQLKSERDRLGRLLGRLQDGVVTVDRSLQVEFANSAARRLLGARLSEGDPLPDPWQSLSLQHFASGLFEPDAAVAEARVSPRADRTYAVVGIPAGRRSDTALLVFTDVSARERRERAEREFVTNAAHELRTPLAAIIGAVEILEAGAKDEPEERDLFLGHIARESARLGRLAHALLMLASAQTRQEPPRLTPIPLHPLLEEIAGGLLPSAGVEVAVECPAGLEALTERVLAGQVVANLAANAAKHTDSGRITLAAFPLDERSVAIEVRDTGRGMHPEEQERVFDRFYRGGSRDAAGFGLGLAIVRDAVRALGGTVSIASEVGVGTTARVVFPAGEELAA
jgi:signal transduction histidine kinase/HAMP domain-containing protein